MIKITVLYPYSAETRFDHDYYRDAHLPMAKRLLGDACVYYAIDKALAGDAPPPFHAMCHIVLRSAEDLPTFWGKMGELGADIPNYTDTTPTVQISEIVVERG